MAGVRSPYLFNPETVESRIASLPQTAKLIHAKKRAGEPSAAFPCLQKTEREILRILGRANLYPHLDELLRSLERCLENGWDAHQLGARDRDEYASLMSDLQVAEHCLIREFTLESPVGLNIQGRKPDLYVRKGVTGAIIEVFRPRELQAFHDFLTDASRLIYDADIRFDYQADVKLDVVSDFDDAGRLVSPWHPIDLDEVLAPIANEALERIAATLGALTPTAREVVIGEWPERNLKITVEFKDVRVSSGNEPARAVSTGKGYGGYEPVGMLARLMSPIVAKAKKRQAGERGDIPRVLVCDISSTVVSVHLDEEHRKGRYAEILRGNLEPQLEGNYDVIALVEQQGWAKPLRMHFAVCDEKYGAVLGELFGFIQTINP
jgi:hypothetical protein